MSLRACELLSWEVYEYIKSSIGVCISLKVFSTLKVNNCVSLLPSSQATHKLTNSETHKLINLPNSISLLSSTYPSLQTLYPYSS